MKTYSDTITNTTQVDIDDIAFTVDGTNISISGQADIVYDYHPKEQGDYDTPTKDAYAELVKVNPIFDALEITIENLALPTNVQFSTWSESKWRAEDNKHWSEYVFRHAENLVIEKATEQLNNKFDCWELDEIEEPLD